MKHLFSKITAVVLATFMTVCAVVSVSATETNLNREINNLKMSVEGYYTLIVYYDYEEGPIPPYFSKSTCDKITNLFNEVKTKSYTSIYEVNADKVALENIQRTATVRSKDLQFIYDLLNAEKNDNNFYDKNTWEEVLRVKAECVTALNGTDEEAIHIAYVNAFNVFNKLCMYCGTMGDVNNDGHVNVLDVTEIQKAVAKITDFNYAQKYVANTADDNFVFGTDLDLNPRVITATHLQSYLIGETETQFDSLYMAQLGQKAVIDPYPTDRVKQLYIDGYNTCNNQIIKTIFLH